MIARVFILLVVSESVGQANDCGVALIVGQLTEEKWERAILPGADYADATIMVASGS